MALWTGSELYATAGNQVEIALTPGANGVFQVLFDGEPVYDKAETGRYPDLNDMKSVKARLREMIEDV